VPVAVVYVRSASPFAFTASFTFLTLVFEIGSLADAGKAATSIAAMARAIAAALTPLRNGGAELDLDAFAPYLAFLAEAGIDGILSLGTTGEGISFSVDERKTALEQFAAGPLPVIAHCGAQTTAATVALAAHAAAAGVEGVAVIAPPYFPLDDDALLAHFTAAARACAPTPFYVYELEKASGYAVPPAVVERLRELVDNLVGMKVSDAPFAKVAPYMLEGLDVFVGAEALIGEGLDAGAAGAVSGLASAFPQVVVEAVRSGDSTAAGQLRAKVERFPRHAALKEIVRARGVAIGVDVRPPLRGLSAAERDELLLLL
jgi:dihydrodipicolinate synthase/N-acetylneuraminate lyase